MVPRILPPPSSTNYNSITYDDRGTTYSQDAPEYDDLDDLQERGEKALWSIGGKEPGTLTTQECINMFKSVGGLDSDWIQPPKPIQYLGYGFFFCEEGVAGASASAGCVNITAREPQRFLHCGEPNEERTDLDRWFVCCSTVCSHVLCPYVGAPFLCVLYYVLVLVPRGCSSSCCHG